MRRALVIVALVGCGAAPPPPPAPEPPPPRARLLDEELRAPAAAPSDDLQLEMPELGSELPRVIVVGEPDEDETPAPEP